LVKLKKKPKRRQRGKATAAAAAKLPEEEEEWMSTELEAFAGKKAKIDEDTVANRELLAQMDEDNAADVALLAQLRAEIAHGKAHVVNLYDADAAARERGFDDDEIAAIVMKIYQEEKGKEGVHAAAKAASSDVYEVHPVVPTNAASQSEEDKMAAIIARLYAEDIAQMEAEEVEEVVSFAAKMPY
jgi:hypothetical protein